MLNFTTNLGILAMIIGGIIIFVIMVRLFEIGIDIWEHCTGKTLERSLRNWEEEDELD